MTKAKPGKPQEGSRSRSQIIVLFIALIVFIMLLFANFAYLNTQSTYDKQYIGHAGELRVLSQRIAKNATEAAAGKAAAFKLLGDEEYAALSIGKGCLTPDERRQIEAHVADSYSFLILIPWTRDLARVPAIAHGHHEKLDGSGYPMGLRGNQISMQTRILTICDIYDALTAGDRPYKKALPLEQARDGFAQMIEGEHVGKIVFTL